MSGVYPTVFTLNGKLVETVIEPRQTLADVLRDELGYRGTHLGCEQGVCGACTVLLNGRTIRSCLVLGVQVHGQDVTTIEGLEPEPIARKLAAFMSVRHGLQCGFCTPGIVMAAVEHLKTAEAPTNGSIREALSGNICRCTGYQGIVSAILDAARSELAEEDGANPPA